MKKLLIIILLFFPFSASADKIIAYRCLKIDIETRKTIEPVDERRYAINLSNSIVTSTTKDGREGIFGTQLSETDDAYSFYASKEFMKLMNEGTKKQNQKFIFKSAFYYFSKHIDEIIEVKPIYLSGDRTYLTAELFTCIKKNIKN